MSSLLNLTFVVIGSCAEAGLNAKSKEPTAKTTNAETRRRQAAERGVPPSPRLPVTLSLFLFI